MGEMNRGRVDDLHACLAQKEAHARQPNVINMNRLRFLLSVLVVCPREGTSCCRGLSGLQVLLCSLVASS